MAIQQEFKPPSPPVPVVTDEEQDDLYEEEPRRRPWGTLASVVLALGLVFVGYQWNQAVGRERLLASQAGALRAEAESLRLRAEEAQRQVEGLEKRVAALSAERDGLAERVAELGKAPPSRVVAKPPARGRTTAAREAPRAKATPVSAKKTR